MASGSAPGALLSSEDRTRIGRPGPSCVIRQTQRLTSSSGIPFVDEERRGGMADPVGTERPQCPTSGMVAAGQRRLRALAWERARPQRPEPAGERRVTHEGYQGLDQLGIEQPTLAAIQLDEGLLQGARGRAGTAVHHGVERVRDPADPGLEPDGAPGESPLEVSPPAAT
jgi:hypothetical protein